MKLEAQEIETIDSIKDNSIILAYRGSIAHGMYIPNTDPHSIDDIDLMGISIPSIDHYFALKSFGSRGTKEIKKDRLDIVIYEFKKFIGLLKNGNPNVLSLLWLEPNFYLKLSPEGEYLIQNRHLFANKNVYFSFVGYAKAQFNKMTSQAFKGYMGQKRKELVQKFGYDTKNAAHLIRLLRMAVEFLTSGNLKVFRDIDSSELLAIKKGGWSLEEVKEESGRLFKLADEAYIRSSLPSNPDSEKIDNLCIEILNMYFGPIAQSARALGS